MICLTHGPSICLTLAGAAETRAFPNGMVTPTRSQQACDRNDLNCLTDPESGLLPLRAPDRLPNLSHSSRASFSSTAARMKAGRHASRLIPSATSRRIASDRDHTLFFARQASSASNSGAEMTSCRRISFLSMFGDIHKSLDMRKVVVDTQLTPRFGVTEMPTATPDMTTVPVFNFIDESGTVVGCGTKAELDYWTNEGVMEGVTLGTVVAQQAA